FEGVPGSAEFRIVRFAEHVVPVQVPVLGDAVKNLEGQPTFALLDSSDPERRAELHWRIALPTMCIVLTLLAVPLARLRPRTGRQAALRHASPMTVLDRYIVRTILGSVLLVTMVLLVLGALFVFIDQQDDIGVGHYTAVSALWFTLLNLPQQAYELLPITVLIGS